MAATPHHTRVSVVIPTLNAMGYLPAMVAVLRAQQPQPPLEIIAVDSNSSDGTAEWVAQQGGELRLIPIKHFTHGGSRNRGAEAASGEIVAFLSQDALPRDADWLAELVKPFEETQVAATFARQQPRPEANPMERFFLNTHFPAVSRRFAPRNDGAPLAFQRDLFLSNVSSAVRRETLLVHPFDETILMSEDQQLARDLLQAGYTVAYCADSVVIHSHNYTFRQALGRYFDSVYSLQQIFAGHKVGNSIRMGTGYLRREVAHMVRRHPLWLPRYASFVLAKSCGTLLGHLAPRLPRRAVRYFSMHKAYWDVQQR